MLLTVQSFAKVYNLSEDALRKAIRLNRLKSIKSGRSRFISLDDYHAYRQDVVRRALHDKLL